MLNKIRRLKWKITDHIKDAWHHYDFAIEEKEEGDLRAAKDEVQEGLNRLQEAKKKLDDFSEYIKDCEYKERQSGADGRYLKEKYSAWRTVHSMWVKDVEDLEEEFEDLDI